MSDLHNCHSEQNLQTTVGLVHFLGLQTAQSRSYFSTSGPKQESYLYTSSPIDCNCQKNARSSSDSEVPITGEDAKALSATLSLAMYPLELLQLPREPNTPQSRNICPKSSYLYIYMYLYMVCIYRYVHTYVYTYAYTDIGIPVSFEVYSFKGYRVPWVSVKLQAAS